MFFAKKCKKRIKCEKVVITTKINHIYAFLYAMLCIPTLYIIYKYFLIQVVTLIFVNLNVCFVFLKDFLSTIA